MTLDQGKRLDLTGPWAFRADPEEVGVAEEWFAFPPDETWRQVEVPVVFDNCSPELDRYTGAGWFRRTFPVPADWRGKRIVLRFEGVSYNASVWLNGELVGANEDAYLPFDFDVTARLDYGGENALAVRIDNVRHKGQFPPCEFWFGQGGFTREACLLATDSLYLEHLRIVAEPEGDGGRFALTARLANDSRAPAEPSLRVTVRDPEGRVVITLCSSPLALPAGAQGELSVEARLPDVKSWSPDSPALYTAEVELLHSGEPVGIARDRFGFRRIEARDTQLLLNGQPLFLQGFNRHEDSPRTGMAVDLAQARADFELMKDLGCNFVRMCHYPHHPGEIALCDELGLLVMIENGMNAWGRADHPAPNEGDETAPEDTPLILETAKRTLRKLVERDSNHPSVILCSVGNEAAEWREDIVAANTELVRYGKSLDPTRLWLHVSCEHSAPHYSPAFFEADEVISVNYYPSLSSPDDSTRAMKELLARLHADFPEKPLLVSEFGYPMIAGEGAQVTALEADWAGLDAPWVAGGVLWHFAHHPWPENAYYAESQRLSPFGYMTRDRKKRYKALEVVEILFKERAGKPNQGPPGKAD